MALTAMSAKDWKLGLDFSTRKVISVDFILVNENRHSGDTQ